MNFSHSRIKNCYRVGSPSDSTDFVDGRLIAFDSKTTGMDTQNARSMFHSGYQ